MNTIKLLKRTVLIALFSFVLVSCATVQSGMQGVQLGMNRQEVVKKLGSDFQVVSMVQTDQGGLEILRFTDQVAQDGTFVTKGYYILHFLNGKLVESHYEDAHNHPGRPGRPNGPNRPVRPR